MIASALLCHLFAASYMAAIGWRMNDSSVVYMCGGSLISERFVLTAGHCLAAPGYSPPYPQLVRLGSVRLNVDSKYVLLVPIKNHIRHPSFKPPLKYFDVALLELSEEVKITVTHSPACLWTHHDFGEHKQATAIGWGATSADSLSNSPSLMKVDLDLLDSKLCDDLLVASRSRLWAGLQDHQLCAGDLAGGKDACRGDSGGPLQVQMNSDTYSVIGITSWGRKCGLKNQPGVYTRVSSFLDWIEDIVWPENERTSEVPNTDLWFKINESFKN